MKKQNKVEILKPEVCKCIYDKDNKLRGLCLRCARREAEAFNRGRFWTYKYFMRRMASFSEKYL